MKLVLDTRIILYVNQAYTETELDKTTHAISRAARPFVGRKQQ